MDSMNNVQYSTGHEPLVTSEILEATIDEQKKRKKSYDPLGTEPHLKEHLFNEMLKVCGKMGLAGAHSGILRGVRGDMKRLLDLTVAALQAANRELWTDILPQTDNEGLRVRSTSSPTSDDDVSF